MSAYLSHRIQSPCSSPGGARLNVVGKPEKQMAGDSSCIRKTQTVAICCPCSSATMLPTKNFVWLLILWTPDFVVQDDFWAALSVQHPLFDWLSMINPGPSKIADVQCLPHHSGPLERVMSKISKACSILPAFKACERTLQFCPGADSSRQSSAQTIPRTRVPAFNQTQRAAKMK